MPDTNGNRKGKTMSATTAQRLSQGLGLDTPPIAMTFAAEAPTGIAPAEGASPSACAFWRQAEHEVFYATAEQHFNCPVGAMVMGFALPEPLQQQLGGLVTSMAENGYLDPQEAAMIPTVSSGGAGIVYGPLEDFPVAPDFVVMWLTPRQAMLFNEAAGSASWTSASAGITGRPACTAIALAAKNGTTALSLGCAGMRTFTDIADDRLLAVTPGGSVDQLADSLEQIVAANQTMGEYYQSRKDEVAGTASTPAGS